MAAKQRVFSACRGFILINQRNHWAVRSIDAAQPLLGLRDYVNTRRPSKGGAVMGRSPNAASAGSTRAARAARRVRST